MATPETSVGRCGRVHFPAEQLNQHDSQIVVLADEQNQCADVHLGFLQIFHDYHIKFKITDQLGEMINCDPLQNVNVQLLEAAPSEDGLGHDLLLVFKAQKDKIMNEELVLYSARNPTMNLKLKLHARVLGKDKGTPSLRQGIHCIGISMDEDSQLSDWQGFE